MTVLGIILIIVSIALVVLVVLQEGKNNRLSGAIAGGNSDTFLGKSKTCFNVYKGIIVAASVNKVSSILIINTIIIRMRTHK